MTTPKITAQDARALFHYDPETGQMWRRFPDKCQLVTCQSTEGYLKVRVQSRMYSVHRVAWLWVHGRWPEQQVDHINGQRSDNRLINLREASSLTNMQNRRTAQRNNRSSGLLGVSKFKNATKKPWQASIKVRGKKTYLGVFATPEEAHDAYLEAKRRLHEGCTI